MIAAVERFLHTDGWAISQSRNTRQTGVDLVATHRSTNRRLCVEAKGATSSKPESNRFGRRFNSAQVKDHVANVFYEAARVAEPDLAGIAVPRDRLHEKYMQPIRRRLTTLNIAVFWIDGSDVVDTWNWTSRAESQ